METIIWLVCIYLLFKYAKNYRKAVATKTTWKTCHEDSEDEDTDYDDCDHSWGPWEVHMDFWQRRKCKHCGYCEQENI